jgi:hypothetical protein
MMTQHQVSMLFVYLTIIVVLLVLIMFGVWAIPFFGPKQRKDDRS